MLSLYSAELKSWASHMLNKHSTNQALPQAPRPLFDKGSISPCVIQVAFSFQHYSCLLSAKIASMSHHDRLALFDF